MKGTAVILAIYFLSVAFLTVAICGPAYAYLDPGTGSIILQAIIGGAAVALLVGRSYLYRIRKWFGMATKLGQNDEKPPSE